MIKNIIFDFGDVFINLDKQIVFREAEKYGALDRLGSEMKQINNDFEVGRISIEAFISALKRIFPEIGEQKIVDIWNGMLLDFPKKRLEFLESLVRDGEYRLFLLSNTNALHIPHVQRIMGVTDYNRFKGAFERFYLSHEIGLRKPNTEVFEFVLKENHLTASETFFIDDTKENTDGAEKLGIRTWNLQVGLEDVVQLKEKLWHV
ncbi:MAG: HAD family phosphatase [Bacteroidota bacterium]